MVNLPFQLDLHCVRERFRLQPNPDKFLLQVATLRNGASEAGRPEGAPPSSQGSPLRLSACASRVIWGVPRPGHLVPERGSRSEMSRGPSHVCPRLPRLTPRREILRIEVAPHVCDRVCTP